MTTSKTALIAGITVAVLGPWSALSIASRANADGKPFVYRAWQTYTMSDGLPNDAIRCIRVYDNKVWVGTDGGVALYQDGAWKKWTEGDGLSWPVVTAIDVQQRTGDVWLGTWGGGLIRFTAGRFDQFTQFNSGLAGDLVFAVAVEGNRVWAATTGGVSSLDTMRDTWELPVPRRADKLQNPIIALDWNTSQNTLFATEWCGHLHKFAHEQDHWTMRTAADQSELPDDARELLASHPAIAAAVVGDSLWEAAQYGLTRSEPGTNLGFRNLPTDMALAPRVETPLPLSRRGLGEGEQSKTGVKPSPLPLSLEGRGVLTYPPRRFVNYLAAPTVTEAWLGTNQGLYALVDWNTDTWVAYRSRQQEPNGSAIVIRDGHPAERYSLCSTIPADWVSCVAFQGDDIWVGTTHGLARGIGEGRWPGLRNTQEAGQSAETGPCLSSEGAGSRPRPVNAPASQPEAVSIAVFGPITKTITLPGAESGNVMPSSTADTLAVQLAVEQANAIGGYRGQAPFALLFGSTGYPRYGWGNAEDDLALFARKSVVGVVAYSGPDSRTMTAATLRTELPIVNVADQEASVYETTNPWMFRCRGDDPDELRHAVDYIVGPLGHTRLALVRTPGAEEGRYQDLWGRYVRWQSPAANLVAEVSYTPGSDNLQELLAALGKSNADVVFTWADCQVSASILREMREAGMGQLFVGSDGIVGDEFTKFAGPNPGAVIAPYPCPHRTNRQAEARFAEKYLAQSSTARQKGMPPREAYLAYHAARHLLLAINFGGTDRHSIRNALETLGDPVLAVLENGDWKPVRTKRGQDPFLSRQTRDGQRNSTGRRRQLR